MPRLLLAIGSLHGGGSERQTIQILQHLDRAKFTPLLYLITRAGELLPEVPADVPVFAFHDRYPRPRFNWPGRIHRAEIRDLARVLREQQIDIIYDRTWHMTLITAAAARHANRAARPPRPAGRPARPIRRVSTAVTNPRQDFERNAPRFAWIKTRMLRRAYHEADRVVAVSEGVRTAVADYYALPPERIATIHNFIDLDRIDRLAAEPLDARRRAEQAGRFCVVAAGRFSEEKGFHDLLAAADDLVNRRGRTQLLVRLLGTGPQGPALKAFASDRRLTDHVRFEGFQPNPYPFFRTANLFCLPSLYEGLPNALLEALACRVPVLATDCESGPREILNHGQYGQLVPPNNPPALAEAIDQSLTHATATATAARDPHTTPARQHIEQHYALTTNLPRLEALLESLCQPAH